MNATSEITSLFALKHRVTHKLTTDMIKVF